MARKRDQRLHKVIILISAFISIMLGDGLMISIGALFTQIIDTFKVSRAKASVVQISMVVLFTGSGIINGGIIDRFGIRKSGLAGATVAAIGVSISFFAPNIPFLVFSIGVCGGIGSSFVWICAFNIVSQHFNGRYSSIVMAIVATSTRIGGIAYPHLLLFLSNTFGVRGAFLICGAILFNSIAFSSCWTLPNTSIDDKYVSENIQNKDFRGDATIGVDEAKGIDDINCVKVSIIPMDMGQALTTSNPIETTNLNEGCCKQNTAMGSTDIEIANALTEKTLKIVSTEYQQKQPSQLMKQEIKFVSSSDAVEIPSTNTKCCHRILNPETVNIIKALMKDKVFMGYVISSAITVQGVLTFAAFVTDIFIDKGLSNVDASNALIIFNVVAFFSSLITGIPCLATLSVPMISAVATIIGLSMILLVNTLVLSMVASAIMGVGSGVIGSCFSVTTEKLVGKNNFHIGVGILFTFTSVTSAVGPLIGYLRDVTESYQTPILVVIGALILGLVILSVAQWTKRRQKSESDINRF